MISEFEKVLRYGRKEKKLSQCEVAEMAGLNTTMIAKLESGLFVPLESENLGKIAIAVGVDPGMLNAMYRSEFRSEIRHQKKCNQASPNAQEEPDKNNTNGDGCIENAENLLIMELNELGKEIIAMPVDLQKTLIKTFQILVRGAYRLHASAEVV